MRYPAVTAALLCSLLWAPDAFGLSADRVNKLVDSGKADKAWSQCETAMRKEPVLGGELRVACAAARYQVLQTAGEGTSNDAWLQFVADWQGTDAAERAREEIAQTFLVGAGDDADRLAAVHERFPGTSAATTALQTLFDGAMAAGTSAAALAFAERYADEELGEQARARASELAFEEAADRDGIDDWTGFQEAWPQHPRRAEAEERLKEARFRDVGDSDVPARLRLADDYPDDPRSAPLRFETVRQALAAGLTCGDGAPAPLARSTDDVGEPGVLPPDATSLRVAPTHGIRVDGVRLSLLRSGAAAPLSELANEPDLAGLSDEHRAALGPLSGAREQGGAWEIDLPEWICQPTASGAETALTATVGGEDYSFPFRVARPCSELAADWELFGSPRLPTTLGAGLGLKLVWEPIPVPPSEPVLAVATLSDGRILVGTPEGLFLSDDQGGSWVQTTGPVFYHTGRLVVAEPRIVAVAKDGLYESTDRGETWSRFYERGSSDYVAGGGNEYIAGHRLLKYSKGTRSWVEQVLPGDFSSDAIAASDSRVVVGNVWCRATAWSGGALFSGDGGRSWRRVLHEDAGVEDLAIIGDDLFATVGADKRIPSTDIYGSYYGILVSSDEGRNWQKVPSEIEVLYRRSELQAFGPDLLVAVSNQRRLLATSDRGQTWTDLNVPFDEDASAERFGLRVNGPWIHVWQFESGEILRARSTTVVP